MFPNPKPVVDAVAKLGGLPGFLFSNPIIAGFFCMIMLPVFGAVAALFFSFVEPGVGGVELFEGARAGAMVAVMLGAVIYSAIFISTLFLPEERTARLQFALGGAIGLGVLVGLDVVVADAARAWLVGN
ncbi:hypothetical protein [Hyphococcus luteus]|uniref:Uncharacterized protein n=1 Tax=Hyphococcus luteus TaxID=2058213 RepID=A0A2S7K2V4_9PROT|nr:hypothetical protein [Marinicaulis flavus]PQA86832.1 hypothetical protein CW354_15240 [Marinicaulis flavus]